MKRGFTLIELLVVMAILGILATLGLGSFRSAQMKGRDAVRKHDLEQIEKALEMYNNDKGVYPDTLPSGEWRDPDEYSTLYIKEIPTDPKSGLPYGYESGGGGSWYKLCATLENTRDPEIARSGCSDGCSCGPGTYNYKISSPNAP